MDYLEKLDFTESEIKSLNDCLSSDLKSLLTANRKLIEINLLYLKSLDLPNYKEVFLKFYDMFLLDNSTFISIFDKYEKEDLIAKITKNINIVEYL